MHFENEDFFLIFKNIILFDSIVHSYVSLKIHLLQFRRIPRRKILVYNNLSYVEKNMHSIFSNVTWSSFKYFINFLILIIALHIFFKLLVHTLIIFGYGIANKYALTDFKLKIAILAFFLIKKKKSFEYIYFFPELNYLNNI